MIPTTPGAATTAPIESAPVGLDVAGGADVDGLPVRVAQLVARLVDGDEVLLTDLPLAARLDDDGDPLEAYDATFTAPATLPVAIEWWHQADPLPAPPKRRLWELVDGSPPQPGGGDLCTLAEVRGRRQTTDSDHNQDAEVQRIISGVSATIAREWRREFVPTTAAARMFGLRCDTDVVHLTPFEARTVTQVRIDVDTDEPVVLAAGDYRLEPQPAVQGTFHRLRVRTSALPTIDPGTGWGIRSVEITGDWGFAAIPADVREAAIVSVVHNMRTTVGQYSVADGQGGTTRYDNAEIPQGARDLLGPYERQDIYF